MDSNQAKLFFDHKRKELLDVRAYCFISFDIGSFLFTALGILISLNRINLFEAPFLIFLFSAAVWLVKNYAEEKSNNERLEKLIADMSSKNYNKLNSPDVTMSRTFSVQCRRILLISILIGYLSFVVSMFKYF